MANIKATGQFTIIDMNDITPSSTAPSNPATDQLWLDTSTSPSVLKRYNGSIWDVVNDYSSSLNQTVKDVDIMYYLSTSSSSLAGGSWVTIAPAWVNGKYMWSKVVTTFFNDTTNESTPTCIAGATGATGSTGSTGATGTGVSSITDEFYLSTSKTTQTGGSWVTTPPSWSSGKYMWTRSKIIYTNPSSTVYTTPLCDSSWEAVNDVKVGGRNLWIMNQTSGYSAIENLGANHITGQKECYRLDNNAVMSFNIEPTYSTRLYKKITFSAWIKYDNVVQGTNAWNVFNVFKHARSSKNSGTGSTTPTDYLTLAQLTGTSDWKKVTYTYDYSANTNYDMMLTVLRFNIESATSGTAWVTGIKVEEGTVATDWTPSPEDVQTQIDTVVSDVSDVKTAITANAIINTVTQSTEWKQTSNAIEQMKSGTRCHNLGVKINANTFAGGTAPEGELYLHGYDVDNAPADVDGYFLFNGTPFYITKGVVNPDALFGNGIDVYLCRNMAASSVFGAYYDSVALKWKYKFLIGSSTTGDLDIEVTYICFGQFKMTSAEGFEYAYLYESPKLLKNAISQNVELVGKYSTKTDLTQTSTSLIASFKSSGGSNLIRNSTGYNDVALWTKTGGTLATATNNNIGGATTKYLYLDNGTNTGEISAYSRRFKLKGNTKYTLSGWFHNFTKCPSFDVFVLSSTTVAETDAGTTYTTSNQLITSGNTSGSWVKYSVSFTTPAYTFSGFIRIDNNGYNSAGTNSNRVHWSALMLNEGEEVPWSPHPSEVYDGSTIIDASGVTILNGGITVKNNAGVTVLSGDVNGNLTISGGLTSGGINNQYGDVKVLDNVGNVITGMNRYGIATTGIGFYKDTVANVDGQFTGDKTHWTEITGANGFYQWRSDPTYGYEHRSVEIKDGQILVGGVSGSQGTPIDGVQISGSTVTAYDVVATKIKANSNGAGDNYAIGDDCWLGDINVYATVGLKAQDNSGKAFLKFGSGGTIGYGGSKSLELSGDVQHSGTMFTNGVTINGTAGTNGLWCGNGDQATWATCNMDIKSWWGLGIKSYDDVRRFVFDSRGGHFYAAGNVSTGGQVTFTAGYGGNQRIAVQSVGVFDFFTGYGLCKYQMTQDGRIYYYKASTAAWYTIAGSNYGT